MIQIQEQPHAHSAGFSTMPLSLKNTSLEEGVLNYNFVTSIIYNTQSGFIESEVKNGRLRAKVGLTNNQGFSIGEEIYLSDAGSGGFYRGYYIISDRDTNNIWLNLTETKKFPTSSVSISKCLKWSLPPVNKSTKLDIAKNIRYLLDSDTLGLEGGDPWEAPNSYLDYKIIAGETTPGSEIKFSNFTDGFIEGYGEHKVGFKTSAEPEFNIGDQIILNIDTYKWDYADNYFSADFVGFTGHLSNDSTNPHYFIPGLILQVSRQDTHEGYNGVTTIRQLPKANKVVTDKPWAGSTPTEPGFITTDIRPSWNNIIVQVLDIKSVTGGYITILDITIDIDDPLYNKSNISIFGKMTNARPFTDPDVATTTSKTAYNMFNKHKDYKDVEEYFLNGAISRKIATEIKTPLKTFTDTKMWGLVHKDGKSTDDIVNRVNYKMYDDSDNLLCHFRITVLAGVKTTDHFYIPLGIEMITSTKTIVSGTFSTALENFTKYEVYTGDFATETSASLWFDIERCINYKKYSLMFKDSKGSWMSYPTNLIAVESQEVARDTYYKEPGGWNGLDYEPSDIDRGTTNYNTLIKTKYIVNTDWVTEEENYIIEDLIGSSEHYLQDPDNNLISVNMITNEIDYGSEDKDEIFQYVFELEVSKKIIKK